MLGLEGAKLGAIDFLILVTKLAIFSLSTERLGLGIGLGTGGTARVAVCRCFAEEILLLRESIERAAIACPCARCASGEMMRSWITSCFSISGDGGLRMCKMSLPSYRDREKFPLSLEPVEIAHKHALTSRLANESDSPPSLETRPSRSTIA